VDSKKENKEKKIQSIVERLNLYEGIDCKQEIVEFLASQEESFFWGNKKLGPTIFILYGAQKLEKNWWDKTKSFEVPSGTTGEKIKVMTALFPKGYLPKIGEKVHVNLDLDLGEFYFTKVEGEIPTKEGVIRNKLSSFISSFCNLYSGIPLGAKFLLISLDRFGVFSASYLI
jgi:hypothetical protein